jgi:hypothetical protein
MRFLVRSWLLFGLAFLLLAHHPKAVASPQCGTCYGEGCLYYGDVTCENGQYLYPAQGCIGNPPSDCWCPDALPNGCISGSGGYSWTFEQTDANCQSDGNDCVCPLSSDSWWASSC